jgi:7,8-dihydro-6-hydroxymethylpterin-pyrophosphokinase
MSETQLKEYIRLSKILLRDPKIQNSQKVYINGLVKYLTKHSPKGLSS